jgi:hypothetical protein
MSAATILTILGIVGELISIAKDAPAVIDEVKSLLAKVGPYVDEANVEVKRNFETAQAKAASL